MTGGKGNVQVFSSDALGHLNVDNNLAAKQKKRGDRETSYMARRLNFKRTQASVPTGK